MDLTTHVSEAEAKTEAQRHLREGTPLAARKLLEPFLRDGSADPETYALFGQACIDAGDTTDALALMRNAPDDGSDASFQARLRLAQLMLLGGEQLEAIDRLAGLAMTHPRDRDVVETLAFALLQKGDADQALILFGAVCREFPLTPRLAVGMIKAFTAQGNFDAALEFAAEADRLLPRHAGIILEWAQALVAAKRFEEAEEKLRKLMRLTGPTKDITVRLANVFLLQERPEEARKFFRIAHRLDPEDEALKHLAAAEQGAEGERASDRYVAGLFDSYAEKFEASLLGLGYRVPGLLHNLVLERIPGEDGRPKLGDMLDLGCGTGLLGVVFHEWKTGFWRGVDLSEKMIDSARRKGLYDDLKVQELTAYLREDDRTWDSIFAADVFCYFGDLADSFSLMLARLRRGGFFAFSVEALPSGGTQSWVKTATGRYAHGEGYLRALTGAARDVLIRPDILRVDRDKPVEGFLVSGFAA